MRARSPTHSRRARDKRVLALCTSRFCCVQGCAYICRIRLSFGIQDNGLKSLGNLSALQRLQSVHLSSNRVTDLAEMERLGYACVRVPTAVLAHEMSVALAADFVAVRTRAIHCNAERAPGQAHWQG